MEDVPWRRSDGPFGAMLLITDEWLAFEEAWDHPPSSDYRPHISTTETAARGDTVSIVILFQGCQANPSGACQALADFRIVKPDGSVYADHPGAPLWSETPPRPGHLQLGAAQLHFEIEPNDPIGRYAIEVRARDMVAIRNVALVQHLEVIE
ncbi:MAG TPA: hypothetical protein ENO23_00435 [Alphaproteobacteria bacterium]|nr:hypothetical protein [Alphaproteobacteria bacterium]